MKVLSHQQIVAAEHRVMAETGITEDALIRRAGMSAAKTILERFDLKGRRVQVVCGCGNNGRDGFAVAEALRAAGAALTVLLSAHTDFEHACRHHAQLRNLPIAQEVDEKAEFIVDAIYGIGLARKIGAADTETIEKINALPAFRISIDVPSGVFCNGGIGGIAVRADWTLTMTALKPCFFIPLSAAFCGEVTVLTDTGIPVSDSYFETVEPPAVLPRVKNTHKGDYGKAILFCGSYGMCGAEILAAQAALRSGVGLLRAAVCRENYAPFCVAVPEAVTVPVESDPTGAPLVPQDRMNTLLADSTAVLIGCGLGRSETAENLVGEVLKSAEIPCVLDADGINALAGHIEWIESCKAPLVLTPHSAEMARLLHCTVQEVENDRFGIAAAFAEKHRCVVVLKGHHTVIAGANGALFVNTTGNPGMATGGSGDVLAGILVGLLAQGAEPLEAAKAAVYLHGKAGDLAAEQMGEAALLPRDLIARIGAAFKI